MASSLIQSSFKGIYLYNNNSIIKKNVPKTYQQFTKYTISAIHKDTETVLKGKWKNELNSTVIITKAENGVITGEYKTAVGDASKAAELIGFYQYIKERESILLGFTVLWRIMTGDKLPTVTAWTGELINNTINTTWILTSSEEPKDQWKNTLINKDVFEKQT